MVLSKREQIILVATLIIVGLLIGDKLVFTPVFGKLGDMGKERAKLKDDRHTADLLFGNEKTMKAKWERITSVFPNEPQTQGKVNEMLNQWAEKWRVQTGATRPEKVPGDKGLQEELFSYSGTGTMDAVASFMWEIETSALPIKIASMQLNSSDGGATMTFTLNISAVYPGAAPTNTRSNPAGATSSEEAAG